MRVLRTPRRFATSLPSIAFGESCWRTTKREREKDLSSRDFA
jgi:hypothetical protein